MRFRSCESGLSLIEVLIALVLVGVGIAALLQSISEAVNMQKSAELASTASNLASESIELYRSHFNAHEYSSLVSKTAEEETPMLKAIGNGAFTRRIDVTQDGTKPNRTWTIAVTVAYRVRRSNRSVTQQTLFAER